MKKASSFWLLPLCLALSACQTGGRWSPNVPPESAALWEKRVSITFTNMPLSNAAALLQAQANKGSRTPVRIVAPPDTDVRTTVSWTAIPVEAALKYMGLMTMHRVFYQGNKAAFSIEGHGDGDVQCIRLRGLCVDALTGKGVECVAVDRVKFAGMNDKDPRLGGTRSTVRPDSEGRFDMKLPVLGYFLDYTLGQPTKIVFGEYHPYNQLLVLRVSSEGYVPQTVELPLTEDRRDYSIDVKLEKADSDKSSE